MKGVVEPEDRLLPEEGEPHQPRRRIRGKTNAGEEKKTELGALLMLRSTLEDEKEAMDQDVGEALGIIQRPCMVCASHQEDGQFSGTRT